MQKKTQHTKEMPQDLTFQFLEDITESFCEANIIGTGGYARVYKGLLENGEEVAVKKFYEMTPTDDVDIFKNEFNNLMRVQHKNIVRLVGYCFQIRHKHFEHNGEHVLVKVAERALCLEYLPGGGLDKHISDESCGLDWNTRYRIIKGICEGLHYLHTAYKEAIYHLNLKPANILLDNNMTPKIGDFYFSRFFDSSSTYTDKCYMGTTVEYMPPEYILKYHISSKFDVFCLGIIILEIMSGPLAYHKCADTPSQEFIELVLGNWAKRLQKLWWHTSHEVKTCIEIAVRCVEFDQVKRPTITEIIDELNKLETARRSFAGKLAT